MQWRHAGRIGIPVVCVLVAGAAGVLAYDAATDDRIADGAVVAGVPVGGLEAGEARRVLARRLTGVVRRPVVARYRDRRFVLAPARARVAPDVEGMVGEAVRRSRRGNALTRALRDLAGREPEVRVDLRVVHSTAAVRRFVRAVERAVGRPARDADIGFDRGRVHRVRARTGLDVRAGDLVRAVTRALRDPRAPRDVPVRVRVDERPDVTLADLAERYPAVITIDTRRKRLRFYRHLRHVRTYRIAIGQRGFSTDSGRYEIRSKIVDPPWHAPDKSWAGEHAGKVVPPGHPDNPLKARWMEFHDGQGIHGTDDVASLGSRASHGCIRMSIPAVKRLYRRVKVGTPVFVD